MGYEKRGIEGGAGQASTPGNAANNQLAENDMHYTEYEYNDVSGSLTVGMPVYVDMRDSGEWNNAYSGTALTGVGRTGGRVVLGTTSAGTGTNLVCVGIYAPSNINDKPNQYDVIRVCDRGRCLISAAAKASGTAVLVGDVLIADNTQTSVLSGHVTRTAGVIVGYATATLTATAVGNSIIAVPGSGTTTQLINGFVALS